MCREIMRSGKRQMTEGIELPNEKKIERLEKRKLRNMWVY